MKKKLYISVAFLLLTFPAIVYSQNSNKKDQRVETVVIGLNKAQELCRKIGSNFNVPQINYEPINPPKYWKKGLLTQMGFSQISLTNWASGGSGSVSLNAYLNFYLNYSKGNMFWENRAQFAYGFIHSFSEGYRKSDDKIIIDSKWGYRAFDKFYASAILNFKSQFSPGFEYPSSGPKMVSKFLAPANFSFGLGMEYKPGKKGIISFNFAPMTTSCIIVTDPLLRSKYGNKPDENIRLELGAQLTTTFKMELFKFCKLQSSLVLFSDYLKNPQNIQVNWDFQAEFVVTKFLTTTLRTNLIYDDNVLIANKNGIEAPRIQFKEVLGVAFAYTFGEFKK